MRMEKILYKPNRTRCLGMLLFVAMMNQAYATPCISQEEVNSIVDNEVLQCVHDEDAEGFERKLIERGASNEMIAHAYCRAMERAKNILPGNVGSEQFQSAAYGFARFADASQLTNLLQIAEATSNNCNAVNAIFLFHSRVAEAMIFVSWGKQMLYDDNVSEQVKTAIWECFTKELKSEAVSENVRTNILCIANKSLSGNANSVFYADRILADYDHVYRQGVLRKEVAREMISTMGKNGANESVTRHFQSILENDLQK